MKNKFWLIPVSAPLAFAAMLLPSTAHALPAYIDVQGWWGQGMVNPTQLAYSSDHFCYMTSVAGSFRGDGESVTLTEGAGRWRLSGSSQQSGVGITANCFPYSTFKIGSGAVNNWRAPFSVNTNTGKDVVQTWQADSALMLSGMTGQFDGGGEEISVVQPANPAYNDLLEASALSTNGVGGYGENLFVGVPHSGFVPSFYGPNAGPANSLQAGAYYASTSAGHGPVTVWMAPSNKAFCYFSNIGGAFDGSGELIQIYTQVDAYGTERWVLHVTSQQSNGTFAEARCYALDQSVSR